MAGSSEHRNYTQEPSYFKRTPIRFSDTDSKLREQVDDPNNSFQVSLDESFPWHLMEAVCLIWLAKQYHVI